MALPIARLTRSSRLSFLLALAFARPAMTQIPSYHAIRDSDFKAPDLRLSWLRGLLVDRKHRVYVPDEAATVLYRLSENGQQSEVIAKEGAGPGEAKSLSTIAWLGDTLVILDNYLGRLTFLNPEGKLLRTENIRDRCVGLNPSAVLEDGRCFESLWKGRPPGAKGPPPPNPYVVGRHQPRQVDTIYQLSVEHSAMQFDRPNSAMFYSQPFSDVASILAAHGGGSIVVVERQAALSSRTDSLRLRRWVSGRGWAPDKYLRYTPLPLTTRMIDSALTGIIQNRGKAGRTDPFALTVDSLRAKVYRPAYQPPVAQAIALRDGSVWLSLRAGGEFQSSRGMNAWVVLDPGFTVKRTIQIPAGLRVSAVDGEVLWGAEIDEDDVPQIVRYRIVPGD